MTPQAREASSPTEASNGAGEPPEDQAPASEHDASVLATGDPVEIRVYRFTGWYGPIRVPDAWCRECDLFIRAANQAAEQADVKVNVKVIPWLTHPVGALWYGGYHPPVMVVDGEMIAQGDDVPTVERVLEAVGEAATERDAREAER